MSSVTKRERFSLQTIVVLAFAAVSAAGAEAHTRYIAGISGDEVGMDPATAAPWFDALGLDAAAIWIWWEPGKAVLTADDQIRVQNVVAFVRRPFAVVSGYTQREPRTRIERREFCGLALEAARLGVRGLILPNEPDLGGFFRDQQRAPRNVVLLLSHCYPKLHVLGAKVWGVNALGLSRPLPFIQRLGRVYRGLLRQGLIRGKLMDGFGFHPYPRPHEAPWVRHTDGIIGMADVGRLRRALCKAFRGTPQGCRVPILYTETGVTHLGGSPSFVEYPDPIGWVTAAHQIASRQRGVVGLLTFQLWDNHVPEAAVSIPGLYEDGPADTSGGAWQLGLLYSSREPKPGIERLSRALADIRLRTHH